MAAIGGDLLDVGGALDPDVQIVVVETPARALITPDYAPGAGVACDLSQVVRRGVGRREFGCSCSTPLPVANFRHVFTMPRDVGLVV